MNPKGKPHIGTLSRLRYLCILTPEWISASVDKQVTNAILPNRQQLFRQPLVWSSKPYDVIVEHETRMSTTG